MLRHGSPSTGAAYNSKKSRAAGFAPPAVAKTAVAAIRELVSEMPNSLLAGKIQGISPIPGLRAPPSLELLHRARSRIADATVPIWLLGASAEYLPFADAIFDTVVTTWTLCSIPDPLAALIEMCCATDGMRNARRSG
jgi:hypothetical protein